MAAFFEKLTFVTSWLILFLVIAFVYWHWTYIFDCLCRSMTFEKTVILKSRGSALNDHVASYVNENNLRRFWPEITIDLLTSILTCHCGPFVKEISLMGGFLRVREFLSHECPGIISRSTTYVDVRKCRHLIVVALIPPSHYVTYRELYLSKMCEKMSNLKFFSIYFNGNLAHSLFATQQIRAAITYLNAIYPNCYFTVIACGQQADVLLNYLGDTGAACKFESAVLLAPTCEFGVKRKTSKKGKECLETKSRSGRLRKISLQEVNTINFEQICSDVNDSAIDNQLDVLLQNVTPKNSSSSILNAFLPDNVDDVAIPVLWIPEQRAEGSIAPVELFEESINFMLLRLDAVVRCRLDLWQNAIQFGIAVHSFFHPTTNGRTSKSKEVKRK